MQPLGSLRLLPDEPQGEEDIQDGEIGPVAWSLDHIPPGPVPIPPPSIQCRPALAFEEWCQRLLSSMPEAPTRPQVDWFLAAITRGFYERRRCSGMEHQGFGTPGLHVCLGTVWELHYTDVYDKWLNVPPEPPKELKIRRPRPPKPPQKQFYGLDEV